MTTVPMNGIMYLGRGVSSTTGKLFATGIEFDIFVPVDLTLPSQTSMHGISSSYELLQVLDIRTPIAFATGWSTSAELSIVQTLPINSYYTYGIIKSLVPRRQLSIGNPRLGSQARDLLVNHGWEAFSGQYGWEYISGVIEGGSYVAALEIRTNTAGQQQEVREKLQDYCAQITSPARPDHLLQEIANTAPVIIHAFKNGLPDDTAITPEEAVRRAIETPNLLDTLVPLFAVAANYSDLVQLPPVTAADLQRREEQKEMLEELARQYLLFRDYRASLVFVLGRPLSEFVEFQDFAESELDRVPLHSTVVMRPPSWRGPG